MAAVRCRLPPDRAHWANGTQSVVYGGSTAQEAAMDPDLQNGTRKRFTELDAAAMKDIGWEVDRRCAGLDGDYNNNGIVDAADYVVWRDRTEPDRSRFRTTRRLASVTAVGLHGVADQFWSSASGSGSASTALRGRAGTSVGGDRLILAASRAVFARRDAARLNFATARGFMRLALDSPLLTLARMLARAQTWWTILRICLEERLVYRGDFWLGTLMRFLPIVTQIFLWGAVFAGMSAARRRQPTAADRRLQLPRFRRVLPADDGQPGVFQHAGAGRRHRAADSQRRDQEVSHPAGRSDRLSAA